MPSHFSTIGVPVGSEAEFWDLAQKVGPLAAGFPVEGGTYFCYRDGPAELWLQVAGDDQFVGMSPHYAGDAAVPVTLTGRRPAATGNPFDGGFDATAGEVAFRFDAPDFARLGGLALPAAVTAQLAAFAHELDVYPSAGAFAEAMTAAGTPDLTDPLFAPAAAVPGAADLPDARVILTGTVVAADEKTSGLTGRRYYWLAVETPVGTLDVVADPTLLPGGPPAAGGVVTGSFWLSGRVMA